MTFADVVNKQIVLFGNTLTELLYALAFFFFLFGMARTFFSNSEETRQKGKQLAFWGIIALFVLFAIWGIIRFLLGILDSFNT